MFVLCMVISNIFGGVKNTYATSTGDGVPLGTIALFPFNFAPMGWVECDGRPLAIGQYQALNVILNKAFGGTDTAFNVPDLRNASPMPGAKYYMCTQGFFGWVDDPEYMMVVGEIALLPDRVVRIEGNDNMDFSHLWMKCDGSVLNETAYQKLYNAIGDNYGREANGFKIPNLTDASPVAGLSYYIAVDGQEVRYEGIYNGIATGQQISNSGIISSIELYAFDWVPTGSVLCNGNTLATTSNTALYSLLGNIYGGTPTNFALPDLRGAAPLPGLHYTLRLNGLYPSRD